MSSRLNKDVLSRFANKWSARYISKYSEPASYLTNEVLDGSSSAADAQVDGCRAEGKATEQKAVYA
jgi:hypothetical protein